VVTLTDGTRLAEDVTAVLGTVNNPMTRDQVVAKSRDLMTPVLGAATTRKIIEKTLNVGNMRSIRELRPVLQRRL
jgi:2-methylcitrate dehydratase PrpD